jgi:aminopeptidase N
MSGNCILYPVQYVSLAILVSFSLCVGTVPAYGSDAPLDIIHTDLHIFISSDNPSLHGEVHYTAVVQTPIEAPVTMNAYWLSIDSIAVNGMEAYGVFLLIQGWEEFGIELPQELDPAPGDTVLLSIWYTRIVGPGEPGRELYREGYYFFEKGDMQWNQTASETIGYTMSQPRDARAWFPTIDEPSNKSTLTMHVTVDNPVAVIANGELTETVVHDDGSVRYTYHHPYPISPYLFSFNAGPFEEYSDSYESIDGRTIPIASYLFGSDAAWADSANSMMKNMMAVFEDLFGPYPFDRYGMIAVEPFRYGGMEHQTITTMRRQLFLNERVTAHEIAHQWWGNMVTCESWDHIWLNEGFASYAEALYIERIYGTDQRNTILESYANTYFFEDVTIRYPLYNPPEGYIFGRAIYQKGAWVLHMLRNVVSDAAFYATLREYAERHAYGAAGTDDLRSAFEFAAGMELAWFFDQWVYEPGYPVYQIESRAEENEGGTEFDVSITLNQIQENAPEVFIGPVEFLIRVNGADSLYSFWNDRRGQQFLVSVPALPDTVIFDPGNKILKKIGNATYIDGGDGIPEKISLLQNYPNPFNSSTTIEFRLSETSDVRLRIVDALGRHLALLLDDRYEPGNYVVTFNADRYASGIYFAVLEGEGVNLVRKMVYIK